MFKLNQNGWGLRVMIAFLCIFVLCLLLAFGGLYKMGFMNKMDFLFNPGFEQNQNTSTINNNDNNNTNNNNYNNTQNTAKGKSYADLQFELVEASKKYVANVYNNTLGIDTLVLTVDNLETHNYITEFKDENGKKCSGYADVYYDQNNNILYNAYIKCKKYQTSGYQEWKDE